MSLPVATSFRLFHDPTLIDAAAKATAAKYQKLLLVAFTISVAIALWLVPRLMMAAARRARLVWLLHRLDGPLAVPLLGTTWQMAWKPNLLTKQLTRWYYSFKRRRSDLMVFWLGPVPLVVPLSAEAFRTVLESQEHITKGDEYVMLRRWLGDGLITSNGGERWRARRKLVTPAFHFSILRDHQPVFDREARILVDVLSEWADRDCVVDIFPSLKHCALDTICETSIGAKVNAQTSPRHPYVEAVRIMNKLSFAFIRMPWLWFRPIWYASGYGHCYDESLKLVTDFTRQVIADRREAIANQQKAAEDADVQSACSNDERPPPRAFLDLLLGVQASDGSLSDEDIREEVETFLFAGHDTIGTALGWSIWCLTHHEESAARAYNEVDRIFGNSNRDCTSDDLRELRYLEMCIKEAMRIFPPVPFVTRKLHRDLRCCNRLIPRGATIVLSPPVVQCDPDHFPNPLTYNPENFAPEAQATRHPYAFCPFSAGPRNCLGQKYAMLETKTVLSWLLRCFRFRAKLPWARNTPCFDTISKPHRGKPMLVTGDHAVLI